MTNLKRSLAVLLVVASVACASAQTNTYKTLATIAQTVDLAHNVYNDLKAAGKITPETQAAVAAAYKKYQEAALIAQSAYVTWKAAGFPGDQAIAINVATSNTSVAASAFVQAVPVKP
jgi:hypothetical protein